jgi:hypothetical protein
VTLAAARINPVETNHVKLPRIFQLIPLLLLPFAHPAAANGLALQPVTDKVYAIVGELSNRSPSNLGNNATFDFGRRIVDRSRWQLPRCAGNS